MRTVDLVQDLFLDNVQQILNRINVFDEPGYKYLLSRHLEYTDAVKPYQASFNYVADKLADNEQILSKLDELILEITHLEASRTPIDQLPVMQEINELIEQTKLYKH
jgi:hypothetical protein